MPEGSSADVQDVPAMDKGKERAFSPQNFENADSDDERDGETIESSELLTEEMKKLSTRNGGPTAVIFITQQVVASPDEEPDQAKAYKERQWRSELFLVKRPQDLKGQRDMEDEEEWADLPEEALSDRQRAIRKAAPLPELRSLLMTIGFRVPGQPVCVVVRVRRSLKQDFFTGQIQIHYGEPAKLIAQAIDPVFETPTETIERGAFAMLLALRTLLPDDVPPSRYLQNVLDENAAPMNTMDEGRGSAHTQASTKQAQEERPEGQLLDDKIDTLASDTSRSTIIKLKLFKLARLLAQPPTLLLLFYLYTFISGEYFHRVQVARARLRLQYDAQTVPQPGWGDMLSKTEMAGGAVLVLAGLGGYLALV